MKKTKATCDTRSCYLCNNCLSEWRGAVACHKKNQRYRKGATIFTEDTSVEGIYFIYSGKVKVHKKWGEEKELILRFAGKGDIIGYRGIGNDLFYPVSATALEDVIICFIDMQFFEATLKVNHNLTYELMRFYANELQEAERRMRNLVHLSVKGRVAETLLMLRKNFGINRQGFIDIALTKQDMASYAGTTYETFSRMIGEMTKEKLIKSAGRNIGILTEDKLIKLTEDTN